MFYCVNVSAAGSTEYSRFALVSMLPPPTSCRHDVGAAPRVQPEPEAYCVGRPLKRLEHSGVIDDSPRHDRTASCPASRARPIMR
jgi:hypothetical protein